jgi:protein-tyrosine phosphatase
MKKNNAKVLFVCLGNICRSPTAHGVFQTLVDQNNLSEQIIVDSCGTGDWHIGHSPDTRTVLAAKERGYDLENLRARQFALKDFDYFDYILTMDQNNFQDVQSMQGSEHNTSVNLFLPYVGIEQPSEVPDPYYGGEQGFETVLNLIEDASQRLLNKIVEQHDFSRIVSK